MKINKILLSKSHTKLYEALDGILKQDSNTFFSQLFSDEEKFTLLIDEVLSNKSLQLTHTQEQIIKLKNNKIKIWDIRFLYPYILVSVEVLLTDNTINTRMVERIVAYKDFVFFVDQQKSEKYQGYYYSAKPFPRENDYLKVIKEIESKIKVKG